jgi:hypothetical protein
MTTGASPSLRGSARDRALHIVERCGGGREHQGQWAVHCPAHDDRDPSLAIGYDGTRVLLTCRVHCETSHILAQLNLTWRDLFDDGRDHPPPPKRAKHLGPHIPEPPCGPTADGIALQVALELIIDDVSLLHVEGCQELFRRMATDPLMRLWIDQQLRRHQLDPTLVWRVVQVAEAPTTGGLRMVAVNTPPHRKEGGAA